MMKVVSGAYVRSLRYRLWRLALRGLAGLWEVHISKAVSWPQNFIMLFADNGFVF
jgi:hypothetical protein